MLLLLQRKKAIALAHPVVGCKQGVKVIRRRPAGRLQRSWIRVMSWHGLHAPVCSAAVYCKRSSPRAPLRAAAGSTVRPALYSVLAGRGSQSSWPGRAGQRREEPCYTQQESSDSRGQPASSRAPVGFYEGGEGAVCDDHETRSDAGVQ